MDRFFVKVNDRVISAFWPNGNIIRIRFDGNIHGNRLEFGHMEKKIFRKQKFIVDDYVPVSIVQSIEMVSA